MPEQVATPTQQTPAAPPTPPRRFVIPDDPAPAPAATPAAPAPAASEVAPTTAQDKGDQATPAASDGETPKDEVVTPEQAAKREGRRFERRLDKAYRQAAEARARADVLEKQLAEARTPAVKPVEGEPKLADFDYDPEKYAAAKAEHAKKQAEKDLTEKQRTQSQNAERQRLQTSWEAQVDKAEDKYDDFREVVGDLKPDSAFVAAIMEAENGSDIAYHLGKHPKEAERIAKLPTLSQIREIGKLEVKLATAPAKPATPSKAPPPIAPLTGAAPAQSDVPSEKDAMDAWMKKRNKQIASRR